MSETYNMTYLHIIWREKINVYYNIVDIKRFYNRETNSASWKNKFCVIQRMSIKSPFPSMQLK